MENENLLGDIAEVLAGNKEANVNLQIDPMSIIYFSMGLFVALFLALLLANVIRK